MVAIVPCWTRLLAGNIISEGYSRTIGFLGMVLERIVEVNLVILQCVKSTPCSPPDMDAIVYVCASFGNCYERITGDLVNSVETI